MIDQEKPQLSEQQMEDKEAAEAGKAGVLRVRTGIRAGGDEDSTWSSGGGK